jgi:hypothetical protein
VSKIPRIGHPRSWVLPELQDRLEIFVSICIDQRASAFFLNQKTVDQAESRQTVQVVAFSDDLRRGLLARRLGVCFAENDPPQ